MTGVERKSFVPWWLLFACCLHSAMSSKPTNRTGGLRAGDREVPGWGVNVCRVTSAYIDPVRGTTIISGREICEDPKTEIVIVIESTPEARWIREAIRKSWGNFTDPKVKIAFIVGLTKVSSVQDALERESKRHKDIIEENFVEAYYNLTLKGIAILKWFIRTCPNAKFLLKADEDTFVDVPLLVHRLASYRNSKDVLRGYLCSNFDRDDRKWSKWYAPKYLYNYDKYPDFLQGSAYYMSRDVAVKLFKAAMVIPIFHLEDVYITGLCAERARVTPLKDEGVEYLFGSSVRYCLFPHIITCNSVESYQLQWVLNERRKLINYTNMEGEPATSKLTIEDEFYNENYLEDHFTEMTTVWKMVENEPHMSDTSSLALAPRSERSGATTSIFINVVSMKRITWAIVIPIFLHAS